MAITIDDIRAAASRIRGIAHITPVHTSRAVNGHAGAEVFFKCENFQRTGAFKIRGAYNALSQLSPGARTAGVLTWSSGNHAQAVALAGRLLDVPTTIVMPDDAPGVKLEATREYGAEIVLYDKRKAVREDLGRSIAAERGLTIIPPYDHPALRSPAHHRGPGHRGAGVSRAGARAGRAACAVRRRRPVVGLRRRIQGVESRLPCDRH